MEEKDNELLEDLIPKTPVGYVVWAAVVLFLICITSLLLQGIIYLWNGGFSAEIQSIAEDFSAMIDSLVQYYTHTPTLIAITETTGWASILLALVVAPSVALIRFEWRSVRDKNRE